MSRFYQVRLTEADAEEADRFTERGGYLGSYALSLCLQRGIDLLSDSDREKTASGVLSERRNILITEDLKKQLSAIERKFGLAKTRASLVRKLVRMGLRSLVSEQEERLGARLQAIENQIVPPL